jgi:hypothetical protein
VISWESVFMTVWTLCWIFVCHQIIRNQWVLHHRIEWARHDLYGFKAKAPSYEYMLWHFWIWDMKQFGFNKGDSSE